MNRKSTSIELVIMWCFKIGQGELATKAQAELAAKDARIAELEATLQRVTSDFETVCKQEDREFHSPAAARALLKGGAS